MPGFRLDKKRTQPKPDRRLGIKLELPSSKKRLGGKLDAYVPPELQYDYKVPSVLARYKVLTAVFVALFLGLASYWVFVIRHSPGRPALGTPAASRPAPASAPQAPQDQPIYIEPLPSK
jgi:hypothetical protein